LAVEVFDAFAVCTHAAPATAAGKPENVYVRSPLTVSPTARFVCSDQLAALAVSATDRLLRLTPPPPTPEPTGGSGACVQLSSPAYTLSRPALLAMLAGIWLGLVIVVLFATVIPPPVV